MPEADQPKSARQWGWISIALLTIGLLIVTPSGLCAGMFAYDLYIRGSAASPDSGLSEILLVVSAAVFVFGLLFIFGAFGARRDPEDD